MKKEHIDSKIENTEILDDALNTLMTMISHSSCKQLRLLK